VSEIFLQQQKGKKFRVGAGLFREFSAANKLMVIELVAVGKLKRWSLALSASAQSSKTGFARKLLKNGLTTLTH